MRKTDPSTRSRRFSGFEDIRFEKEFEPVIDYWEHRQMQTNESPQSLKTFSKVEILSNLLTEAINYGYDLVLTNKNTFQFSPIDLLITSVTDILLIIGEMIQQGVNFRRKNPDIIFKPDNDRLGTDPRIRVPINDFSKESKRAGLHTLKSIKVPYPIESIEDPKAKEIFWHLAEAFIQIRKYKNIRQSFHDFAENCDFLTSNPRIKRISGKQSSYQWWRRQQRRSRRREARNHNSK